MKPQQLFASIAVLALVLVGSGCQSQAVEAPTVVAPVATQTQPATVTAVPTEPIALIPGEAAYETEEQKAYADSDKGKKEQEWLSAWLMYWSTARPDQRPVSARELGSAYANVSFKLLPDLNGSGEYTTVFEPNDNLGKLIILPPIWAWKKMDMPPAQQPGHTIPIENSMLKLSTTSDESLVQFGIPTGSALAYLNGTFVMVNENGKTIGRVNPETSLWEAVTEEGITAEAMQRIPETGAQIKDSCAELPALSNETLADFEAGYAEYVEVFNRDVLPNYTGPVVKRSEGSTGLGSSQFVIWNRSGNITEVGFPACFKSVLVGDDGKEQPFMAMTLVVDFGGGSEPLTFILDPDLQDSKYSKYRSVNSFLMHPPLKLGPDNRIELATREFDGNPASLLNTLFSRIFFGLRGNNHGDIFEALKNHATLGGEALFILRGNR